MAAQGTDARLLAQSSAEDFAAAGISVIPIRTDGSKAPAIGEWEPYKTRIASAEEIKNWYATRALGVAIICGAVSGNLFVLDFEHASFFQEFSELVEAVSPGLIGEMAQVETPGKTNIRGRHLFARADKPISSKKLAKVTKEEAEKMFGDPGKQTAIEIKGEGGYVVTVGSPGSCHESGRVYHHFGGPFIHETKRLTEAEVKLLLDCAKALDHTPAEKALRSPPVASAHEEGMDRPGDVFNRRAKWEDILVPHGWGIVRVQRGVAYWRRPGKQKGISATTGFCKAPDGKDLLCVFSANAGPLAPRNGDHECFSKFAARAILDHNGDWKEAALRLAERGYGIDVGLSDAESEAWMVASGFKKEELAKPDTMRELIVGHLRTCNVERKWGMEEAELRRIAETAVTERLSQDPEQLSDRIRREMHDEAPPQSGSTSPPEEPPVNGTPRSTAPWHLIVIDAQPTRFLLRSPFWSGEPKVAANGGYIRLTSRILDWSYITYEAMDQAGAVIPRKLAGWPGIHLKRLMTNAPHQKANLEERIDLVIWQFLLGIFNNASERKTKPDGSPEPLGTWTANKLATGEILVKYEMLYSRMRKELDPMISRERLVGAMESAGMIKKKVENSRWWCAESIVIAKIGSKIYEDVCKDEDVGKNGHID